MQLQVIVLGVFLTTAIARMFPLYLHHRQSADVSS
jgi:hypothetical protein